MLFVVRIKNFNTSEKELVSYAGIYTAISYVEKDNERKVIPMNYFFSDNRFVMLSVFDLPQNYIAIPQDFSKIQNLIEFGYLL